MKQELLAQLQQLSAEELGQLIAEITKENPVLGQQMLDLVLEKAKQA